MPLVSLSGVSISFGARTLFAAVNLTIASGTRMALVGPNGSGKTTLMKVLAGLTAPDTGGVVREKEARVSYVPQSGVMHQGVSLSEEAETAFAYGKSILQEMNVLEEKLGTLTEATSEGSALLERHHALQERLAASGYWGRAEAISRVLTGLGFSREDFGRNTAEFSGGWQMRIALAKAILEQPDILLLDEPTNYLDLEARTWLEQFLQGFAGGVLLVSHDRYFLDVTVHAVAEIYMSRVSIFTGNYTHYEEVRAAELASIMARYQQQQEEIARVEAFIRRFRYNASKARLVQSRITYLEKLDRIEVPPVVKSIRFSFPPPPPTGRLVVAARGLRKSYADKEVFDAVDFELEKGTKLAVVGVNGAGKSTLLRLLSRTEEPDQGDLTWGTGIVQAAYSQENADSWATDRTVVEEVESAAPTHLVPEARNMLGAFLFRGDDVYKPVSVLSGGEKSRLALLLLLLRPANLLILDEPTNHLDLASKDMLMRALADFPATVIFVSHDRYFLDTLATAVLELRDGKARWFPGGYEYYQRKLGPDAGETTRPQAPQPAAEKQVSVSQRERQEDKKLKSTRRSLEKEESQLMAQIEELEATCRRLEADMSVPDSYANGERMRELTRAHAAAQQEHAALMSRWEELCGRISSLKQQT